MQVYEPAEDSFLILKHVKDYARGLVLDMGTGSGILAFEAAKHANFVIGADINPRAVSYANKELKKIGKENIIFVKSDLFDSLREKEFAVRNGKIVLVQRKKGGLKFDVIFFNPPYLPKDGKYKEVSLDGGKEGHEIIEKFLGQARKYLKRDGKILLLFSSHTNKKRMNEIIKKNKFKFKQIDSKRLFFEELHLYVLSV